MVGHVFGPIGSARAWRYKPESLVVATVRAGIRILQNVGWIRINRAQCGQPDSP
jgi:hypothetical protein